MSAGPAEQPPTRPTPPPNHIFIGKKPRGVYVTSAMIQLAQAGEVVLKARGLATARALDVARILTMRAGADIFEIKQIKIGEERLTGQEGQPKSVTTVEITIAKK
ncbi:MAG: DNA-binding protein [Nitrososphaerota archaeon]